MGENRAISIGMRWWVANFEQLYPEVDPILRTQGVKI